MRNESNLQRWPKAGEISSSGLSGFDCQIMNVGRYLSKR